MILFAGWSGSQHGPAKGCAAYICARIYIRWIYERFDLGSKTPAVETEVTVLCEVINAGMSRTFSARVKERKRGKERKILIELYILYRQEICTINTVKFVMLN